MIKLRFDDIRFSGFKKRKVEDICLEGEIESFSICGRNELCIWIKDKPGCYRYKLKNERHIFAKLKEEA